MRHLSAGTGEREIELTLDYRILGLEFNELFEPSAGAAVLRSDFEFVGQHLASAQPEEGFSVGISDRRDRRKLSRKHECRYGA